MKQIRIHGRGGQGSVTLAHLIAEAAFEEGHWAQAFPAFGVERRGAPVEAFARIDDERITDRSQVTTPSTVLVQDPTLIEIVDISSGISEEGDFVVNSAASPKSLDISLHSGAITTVDATAIALEHLGRPIMNTALLGAVAGATGLLSLDSIETVTTSTWDGELGRKNAAAAAAAYEEVKAQ